MPGSSRRGRRPLRDAVGGDERRRRRPRRHRRRAGRLALGGGQTVLFLDEIHRFNKAQQDALLPHVEDGTITLIGATTENPYFEVNSALLSRLRVWRLEPLTNEQVAVRRPARARPTPSAGSPGSSDRTAASHLGDEAFDHLVDLAGGDARTALNVLEGAVALAEAEGTRDADGRVEPTLDDVEQAAQQRVLAYDRAGDGHYDTVIGVHQEPARQRPRRRALLARLDGRGRRGPAVHRPPADHRRERGRRERRPAGAPVAVAASQALDWVGLPEAQYALAQATVFIAISPKSDSVGPRVFAALADVMRLGSLPVPNHLRTAGDRRMKAHGIGVGYRVPATTSRATTSLSSTCPTS